MEDDQIFLFILLFTRVYVVQIARLGRSREIDSQETDRWQILSGDVMNFESSCDFLFTQSYCGGCQYTV